MKRGSQDIARRLAQARYATIKSVDPDSYAVKVLIQPEGILTGWLPCGAAAVGIASISVPPIPEDQVIVEPMEGSAQHWAIIARVFSATARPPISPATNKPVQSGEIGIFTPGAWLHFTGGNVYGAATDWNLSGNLNVTGGINATHDVVADSGGSTVSLANHDHKISGVQFGSSTLTTSAPVPGS
ncbi:hypothetical protein SAMN02746095_02964 [Acidocella aminolytica 101 = DSM 11237]|uniref:Phage related baseplate assembly protein n=2 Tax=Acidocella TaxID=50709 RepID=A0A0D6PEY9_9PROT|nr:phage related baseplate assembly protein [Acidocella aminolytica 101 = DSM 11237]GBQ31992.1 hypothetical protein AA11237_0036 [Acidocella aminolytica 101 = DSM 11237]SHF35946.1 hypothetical protein SAMN02746095_02964 [Acidocella aminolytica 101 = DSM 11237]